MTTWTEDMIDRLEKLVAKRLSAGQIAKELDMSRNAVIGKIHRSGLQLKGKLPRSLMDARKADSKRPRKKAFSVEPWHEKAASRLQPPQPQPPPPPPPDPPKVLGTGQYKLFDLTSRNMCRFPYGEVAPFTFCGQKVVAEGSSWCAEHCHIVYQRSTAS